MNFKHLEFNSNEKMHNVITGSKSKLKPEISIKRKLVKIKS